VIEVVNERSIVGAFYNETVPWREVGLHKLVELKRYDTGFKPVANKPLHLSFIFLKYFSGLRSRGTENT
jgi:hypothetical protein